MTAPNTPINLKVVNLLDVKASTGYPQIKLTWDTVTDAVSYNVYRNYVPYGTFTKLTNVTINEYTDNPAIESVASDGITSGITRIVDGLWYYSVTALNSANEESLATAPTSYLETEALATDPFQAITIGGQSYGVAPDEFTDFSDNEDLADFLQRLQGHAMWQLLQDGQDVILFKRLVEGTKCPHWQDDAQSCVTPLGLNADHSDACYGTGIVGGYYYPIKIRIRLVPAKVSMIMEREGFKLAVPTQSWTIWTPKLSNNDFFVTSDGSRYEISNVTHNNMRGGLVTHQVFDIIRKWEKDLIYSVPVPISLRT